MATSPRKKEPVAVPENSAEEEEAKRMKGIADYLRSGKGLPVKQAVERLPGSHHDSERRSEYFKGARRLLSRCCPPRISFPFGASLQAKSSWTSY